MKNWAYGMMSNDEKRNILDQHKSLYNGYKTMQPEVSNTQPLYVQDFANDKGGVTVNNKFDVKKYMNIGINEQVEEGDCMECGDKGYMEEEKSMCSECGGVMMEGECSECGWREGEMEEDVQQVEDLDNVEDLNLSDKFDYVEMEVHEDDALDADALQNVTGQEVPHDADDMAPDGMDDDSDDNRAMMADGEMEEQVGGGTAPYQNFNSIDPAYNFVSGGPLQEDEPMDEYEKMESAWSDDNMGDMDDGEELYPTYSDDKFVGMSKVSGDMEDDESNDWEEIDVFSEVDEDLKESVLKQKNRIMEMMNRMKGFN